MPEVFSPLITLCSELSWIFPSSMRTIFPFILIYLPAFKFCCFPSASLLKSWRSSDGIREQFPARDLHLVFPLTSSPLPYPWNKGNSKEKQFGAGTVIPLSSQDIKVHDAAAPNGHQNKEHGGSCLALINWQWHHDSEQDFVILQQEPVTDQAGLMQDLLVFMGNDCSGISPFLPLPANTGRNVGMKFKDNGSCYDGKQRQSYRD